MPTKKAVRAPAPTPTSAEIEQLIPDAEHLTPAELRLEKIAAEQELMKRSWMGHTAEQLVGRIPTSVFAIAGLGEPTAA